MTTTTRGNIVTPDDTTPNDFALAMGELAQDAMDAVYQEGPVSGRPAAASSKGLLFRATDTNTSGGWFASDGTQWVRLTASPWVAWTPTVTVTDGSGGVSPVTATVTVPLYLYRLLPGSSVEVTIEALVALNGTQQFTGLLFSSPVASAAQRRLTSEAMNDVSRARVEDAGALGNVIAVYPYGAYAIGTGHQGQWYTDSFGRYVFVSGVYPV